MGKMPGRPPGEAVGGGGRTAAGRAARRVAEGQHDSSGGAPDEAVPRVAPPEEIAGYATVRICGGRRIRSGRKTGERMVRGFFRVPQGGRSCGWPGDEPAGGDRRLCHSPDLRRIRSGRKNGRTNGARIFPSTARRAELRLARGLARRQARRDGVMSICRQAPPHKPKMRRI